VCTSGHTRRRRTLTSILSVAGKERELQKSYDGVVRVFCKSYDDVFMCESSTEDALNVILTVASSEDVTRVRRNIKVCFLTS
jgi:hypothetical protein